MNTTLRSSTLGATRTRVTRILAATALVLAACLAAPAAAVAAPPPTTLPTKCGAVLPARTLTLPGLVAYRPYTPPLALLYGVTDPSHKALILSRSHITCSWAVPTDLGQRFTITETIIKSADVSSLRTWYSDRGITPRSIGGDTLNLWYFVPRATGTEIHVLFPRGYWYTIVDLKSEYTPAITQDAIDRIYALNPGLF